MLVATEGDRLRALLRAGQGTRRLRANGAGAALSLISWYLSADPHGLDHLLHDKVPGPGFLPDRMAEFFGRFALKNRSFPIMLGPALTPGVVNLELDPYPGADGCGAASSLSGKNPYGPDRDLRCPREDQLASDVKIADSNFQNS